MGDDFVLGGPHRLYSMCHLRHSLERFLASGWNSNEIPGDRLDSARQLFHDSC